MIAARLLRAIQAAGVPAVDVRIGSDSDRSTWLVHPRALQADAQPTIDAFTLPTADQLADELADFELSAKIIRALARETYDAIPANPNKPATFADFMQRVKARYKALTT